MKTYFSASGVTARAAKKPAEVTGAEVLPGERFAADVSREELKAWMESLFG